MKQRSFSFKKINFENKIIACFILTLLLLSSIIFLINKSNTYFISSAKWVEHSDKVLTENQKLLNSTHNLINATRAYIISGNEETLVPFYQAASYIPSCLNQLKSLTVDNPSQQHRLKLLGKLFTVKIQYIKNIIELRKVKGFESAKNHFDSPLGGELSEQLIAVIEQLDAEERRLLVIRKTWNEASTLSLSVMIKILTFFIICILIIGFIVICNNVRKRSKAEAELTRNNKLIQSIISNASNPISIRIYPENLF